ncbi:alpha-L-arabinofuranosidase [Streptomyces tateyamensis]|uniref:Alpha-L-arabinofuranosidase n=1 Tax=Streptomyces tateyamensis TaxID=565073 RepID=A0A2V4P8C1_9ACTN|nr:arabinofuranosidase catalytic domain-containing protein [Streptomyces tateyamensis]PYC79542.1 alpha-L-arabinofuranosidase [Streptomyces tateyamensis]
MRASGWGGRRKLGSLGASMVVILGAFVGTAASTGAAQAAAQGPCDIYQAGGTPCVAAHSTTRALYAGYSGALYQVKRASDGATANIGLLAQGGVANAAAQDSFCAGTSCVITVIYDQSGRGNNLTPAPAGGYVKTPDNPANATSAPVTVGGQKAYGVFISPGVGYRDDSTNGVATGDSPEGIYGIVDGTHYNNQCCFDYGNAETTNNDDGNGTMEALYFGNATYWDTGAGNGPWVMADLENGLFSGSNVNSQNPNNPSISHRFTTAVVKGESNQWALRGGDAQSGGLSTLFSGARPAGYNPMKKEGAILLGIGGDNSNGAAGTFYEGAMTAGYPSDATENAVQANITAAGYAPAGGGGATTGALHADGAGQCLDDPNGTTTGGTQLQIWGCNGQTNQTWTHTPSNQLTVTNNGTTDCLDANGQGTSAGTKVIIWPCNGASNQQWQFNSNGTITGVQSGLCLDVTGGATANGTPVELWTCHGGSNQQWHLG